MAQYWLHTWLDDEGIGDAAVAQGVVSTRAGLGRLVAAAERAMDQRSVPEPKSSSASVVAGGALSLSGVRSCSAPACLVRAVDQLILQTWHHFDRVIVSGLDPTRVLALAHAQQVTPSQIADSLVGDLAVATYVRDIDATDSFFFQRPARLCTEHLDRHAAEAGLPPSAETAGALAKILESGYEIGYQKTDEGLRYGFSHPALNYVSMGDIGGSFEPREDELDLAQLVSMQEAHGLTASHIRDVAAARAARAALGRSTAYVGPGIPGISVPDAANSDQVSLQLELPVATGLSARELIELRSQNADEFSVFRGALNKMVEERIKSDPTGDSSRIAESVTRDLLVPELATLERRIRLSSKLARRRSEFTLAAGGLVTTIGALAFAPLVVPGLVLAAGGAVTGINDLLKEKRDIELSDLHFLWRVSNAAAGRH